MVPGFFRRLNLGLSGVAVLAFAALTAQATPQVVRVDGSVFDSSGNPITASKDIQVKAYDAATGGTLLWTSSVYNTVVNAGRFTINLDASTGSPSLAQQLSSQTTSTGIYFQIEVDSGAANGTMDSAQVNNSRIRAKGSMFSLSSQVADSLKGVNASSAEMNYLVGVTALIQSQINALSTTASSGLVKTGDTMTGNLGLAGSQATPSRALILDSNRRIASSSVTDTELGYLSGVTSNLAAKINSVLATDMSYLAGVTAGVQSQINAINSTVSGLPTNSTALLKAGDTMTGDLGLLGSQAIPSRALILDSNRRIASSSVTNTELTYLSGVTSNLAAKINSVLATDMSYLAGVTAGVQSQINAISSAAGSGLVKSGDTMTGDLGLSGSQATPSRALILDSSRRIASSSVTNTELTYLSGVTSNLAAKINSVLATDMSYLAGVTAGVQSQINAISSTVSGLPTNSTALLKAGDTMTGGLGLAYAAVTPSRFLMVDSARKVSTSSNAVSDTEFGYLVGVTQSLQTQLNAKATGTNYIAKAADTMTGDLGLAGSQATPSRALILDSSRRIASSTATDTEVGYLSGVTQSIQTQLNAKATGSNYVLKAGDTLTGNLTVNLAQVSGNSYAVSGATVNFNNGNVQVLSSVGSSTITLQNMKDGGAYTVVVTDTTARTYSFSGCTVAAQPTLSVTSGRTVFSILYIASGTTCFISWISGY